MFSVERAKIPQVFSRSLFTRSSDLAAMISVLAVSVDRLFRIMGILFFLRSECLFRSQKLDQAILVQALILIQYSSFAKLSRDRDSIAEIYRGSDQNSRRVIVPREIFGSWEKRITVRCCRAVRCPPLCPVSTLIASLMLFSEFLFVSRSMKTARGFPVPRSMFRQAGLHFNFSGSAASLAALDFVDCGFWVVHRETSVQSGSANFICCNEITLQ